MSKGVAFFAGGFLNKMGSKKKEQKKCEVCQGVGFNEETERQCPECDGSGVK